MIRLCTEADKEPLTDYLKDEPYGRAIAAAIEGFGLDARFQTVYLDEALKEEGECEKEIRGVYLWMYNNLLLYSKENQIEIDFLEQMMGIQAPERVAGRKDNVDIVSWLLTDYHMETGKTLPEITGENGKTVECLDRREHEGEWAVLTR